MKTLTLKVIALIALTSSDRGQTLHLCSTKDIVFSDNKIEIVIKDKVKTSRKFLKSTIVTCVSSDIVELDVVKTLTHYLERTSQHRNGSEKLFISWKTFKPVCKQTLARWLTLVLKIAKIDTSIFKAHSFRGASLSHAYSKGASINQIVAAGNWTNASTFFRFYNAPSSGA